MVSDLISFGSHAARWCADGVFCFLSSPSGSVLVSGSNPNPDYTVGPGVVYPTEYRTEIFYPSYYNQRRPQPKGLLAQYSYGGPSFDITLSVDDLFGDLSNANATSVVIIRPGFSTHAMVRLLFYYPRINSS